MVRHVVLYARISVATEESVSIARQLDSGRKYAAARGWKVLDEFVDEGVSATRNSPSDRAAWQALLNSSTSFDAVVVWKVDRLVRRVIDFLQVDELLQARGAAIVCVEQSIDMTSGEGRAFAQMLAVFAELEASAISARRRAAREYLLKNGRTAGGRPPYGWRLIPNPDGPGKVRAHDPERIEWLREMVARAMRGDTLYSIYTWLNEVGAPPPRGATSRWAYSSLDRILRNLVLAGMTAFNPGNNAGGSRGPEVLRNPDGTPTICSDAIVTVAEFERLQQVVTHKEHHAAIPVAKRRSNSPILSRTATCAACGVYLNRHSGGRTFVLRCRRCGQTITYPTLAGYVIQRLLQERGSLPIYRRTWEIEGDRQTSRKLATLDLEITRTALALTSDRADAGLLTAELAELKRARSRVRLTATGPSRQVLMDTGRTLEQVWDLCTTDEQRRDILRPQIASLIISKSTRQRGRVMDPDRVRLTWTEDAEPIAPAGVSLDAMHAETFEPFPWISINDAAAYVGCSAQSIRKAVEAGQIAKRDVSRSLPSLSRASVRRFLAVQQGAPEDDREDPDRKRPQAGAKGRSARLQATVSPRPAPRR